MTIVAIGGLCPEIVRGRMDDHSLIADDERRLAGQLDDFEFHTATRVPSVCGAEVRCINRVIESHMAHEDRANISLSLRE